MPQRMIEVNGITLAVTEAGDGPPVLLLHGVTVAASFMSSTIESLASEFRVIAPDLRGHGASSRPERFSLTDHIQDVRDLLRVLAVGPVSVVGVSMGSYIAQGLAVEAPELIARLVLVVSKANGLVTSSDRVLAEHAEELAGLTPLEQQQWLVHRMFAPGTPPSVRDQFARWYELQAVAGLELTPAQVRSANEAVGTFDFRPRLADLNVPTLIISGRHDILNPPADGAELVEIIPGARQVIFESSGHLPSWEEAAEYEDVLKDFLRG